MTELSALVIAVFIAGLGFLLRLLFRLGALDTLVVVSVLAELVKKLCYVAFPGATKSTSLVLAAPLLLGATWVVRAGLSARRRRQLHRARLPLGLLTGWFGVLAFFTLLNPHGSGLVLLSYSVVLFWILGLSTGLSLPSRVLASVFWLALVVGAYNIGFGPDPIWRAYRAAAAGVSVGALYAADQGYTGSLFSSPAEYGTFILAATGLLAASGRPPTLLVIPSVASAVLTGSRYVVLGVLVFWAVYAMAGVIRLRPFLLITLVLVYSPLQDAIIRLLLQNGYQSLVAKASGTFSARLLTLGTLGARVGFWDALSEVVRRYGIRGVGLPPFWGQFAGELPDDRHNLLLWLIIRGGIWALVLYLSFMAWHYRLFYQCYRKGRMVGRVGLAYLTASLLMSMGGPQATSGWFFLALGVLAALALGFSSGRAEPLKLAGGQHE